MTTQTVENVELFSEAKLEALEFVPEELENIESELYPNLDSISLEEVAKDLEAYFEGGVEGTGLEVRGRGRSPIRSPSPDPSSLSINHVDYAEVRPGGSGRGARKIQIWRKGVANDKTTYGISPNPHDNRQYNKKQAEFYRAAAEAIVAGCSGSYPQEASFSWKNVTYTLKKE